VPSVTNSLLVLVDEGKAKKSNLDSREYGGRQRSASIPADTY
jgi:hypothetical protein